MNLRRIIAGLGIAAFVGAMLARDWPTSAAQPVKPTIDFSHDVVPILKTHCVECHGGEKAEGGFSLNTRELMLEAEVVEPGDVESSYMMERVISDDPEYRMPPPDHEAVPPESIKILRRWVLEELPWEEGFSFASQSRYEPPLEPRRPDLPPAVDGRANPVDRIIDAYLAAHDQPRPAPISDAEFMRRASFDIVGLPPTSTQLAAFVADPSAGKRSRFVDELLNDRETYATHWLTFWNDLLRNAYTGTGYIEGGRKQITSWLYRSLLENTPFDEFVRTLIAPSPESEGFIAGFKWRGNVNVSQSREVQFAQNVGQVFLGINLKCASCHDSFIDRWTLRETFSLAAVYATEPLELHRCDKPQGTMAQSGWLFPELGTIDSEAPREARLNQLSQLITHPQNGRLNRTIVNRLWHRLMGRGIVHPVDAMNTRPWSEDLLDYLAVYLTDEGYDLQAVVRLIATSEAYQSQCAVSNEEAASAEYVYAGPVAKRMTVEQFLDAIGGITENWPKPEQSWFTSTNGGPGGQLAAILEALEATGRVESSTPEDPGSSPIASPSQSSETTIQMRRWGHRPLRAALRPLDLFQASMGRPNREQVVTSRPTELTTLEAITLANGADMTLTLREAAENLKQREFESPRELVEWLYLAALSRPPTESERELLVQAMGDEITQNNIEDLLWNVFMLPEFQLIR